MVEANHAVAALRISGDGLVPEEVSLLLGHEPTTSQRLKSGAVVWVLEATEAKLQTFDHQIAELLGKVTPDSQVWHALHEQFEVDIYCGWFMSNSNEGVSISPATLRALSQRGIALGLEIYAPSKDA